jgi:cysteinyl-tRNA synthetase
MSKSLKNFITIREALQQNTSRQLRFAFLLHSWKDTLDYSKDTMAEALGYEKLLNEFFLSVKDIIRKSSPSHPDGFTKWQAEEMELNEKFINCQQCVHEALCDSINTKAAMEGIKSMIGTTNVYISTQRQQNRPLCHLLLKKIAAYFTRMMKIFGAIDGEDPIGFPAAGAASAANMEETVMPYLDAFAKFRDDVRQVARDQKSSAILKLCDAVRDDILPNLGVRLEDHEGQDTVIKLADKETLLRERQEKLQMEEAKRLEKERKKAEMAAI